MHLVFCPGLTHMFARSRLSDNRPHARRKPGSKKAWTTHFLELLGVNTKVPDEHPRPFRVRVPLPDTNPTLAILCGMPSKYHAVDRTNFYSWRLRRIPVQHGPRSVRIDRAMFKLAPRMALTVLPFSFSRRCQIWWSRCFVELRSLLGRRFDRSFV